MVNRLMSSEEKVQALVARVIETRAHLAKSDGEIGTMVAATILGSTATWRTEYSEPQPFGLRPSSPGSSHITPSTRCGRESCSLVNDIRPAAQIVRDVVREAEEVIGQFGRA